MPTPYNLLIITPDQLRADYLGCYGHPTIGTAHIDRLAAESVRFQQCYCAAPLCGPSRISFATSTYLGEHNHRNYGSTVDPAVPNLVTALKQAGYRTGMFGKNHLFTYDKLPAVWDELDEICLGNYDNHPDYHYAYSAFTLDPAHPYNITGRLTTETIDFMQRAEQPFIAWVNYQDPHPAFTCPPPYDTLFDPDEIALPPSYHQIDREGAPLRNEMWRVHSRMPQASEAEMRRAIAMYMGQVRYVDDSVGRLLGTLEQNRLAQNTVVLFFSDHGELLGDHGMTHKLPAFYDSLTRIPTILRHPAGAWAGSVFQGLVEEVDLAPTLLELLGITIPPTMVGRSWVNALDAGEDAGRESILCEAGGGAPTWREPIPDANLRAPFAPTSFGPGAMLRKGEWKLSIYHDDAGELYNLTDDPHEMTNRYHDPTCRAIRDELTLALLKRVLGVKVRDVGLQWPGDAYPVDVRFEPLD
ncbi:MAG: sulfatase family protein [Armatimonadota bacterium]